MATTVFVARESDAGEPRVAASAETVRRMVGLGMDVLVEKDAGEGARIPDGEFEAAGATLASSADAAKADVVLKVRRPTEAEIKAYKSGAIVIAIMDPYGHEAAIAAMARAGLTAFAMELMPRITRAQSMDVLSSQANLAGYQAVIDAAHEYDRAMPMMMTAAGTVPAAKVFVMGAGVAGLQAIATAKRLGAAVSATDVRPAAKEQVASLGGKFIAVEDEEFKAAETAGGYAKEMSKEYQAKQAKLVAEHIAKQDIVITTALIPGRPAPRLVTREMLKSMKPGSVAVDLAVERGGNIEGAVGDRIAEVEGVRVIGYTNAAGRIAASASALYAKNLYTFLDALFDKESKTVKVDLADEIVKATALTHGGQTVHPNFKDAAEAASAATPVEATTPPADDKEVKTAAKGTEPGLDVAPKAKRSSTRTRKSAAKPADEGAAAPKKRTRTTTKKGDS